mgnify:CR=1 FL=1
MNVVSITEPSSRAKIEPHPPEDYILRSTLHPIFVVADGVTLAPGADGRYPDPSGAAEAARVFCETAIREAEKLFENFSEKDLIDIFRAGNEAVGEYNRAQGRTKETIDHVTFDLFSTTTAFALLKDGKLYWFSLCDSFVFVFDETGKEKFTSPGPFSTLNDAHALEQRRVFHRAYRNGVSPDGKPNGYGVVTGESSAETYLNQGVIDLAHGDLIALCTDGFESYLKTPDFISLLKEWPGDLKEKVRVFSAKKIKEDPSLFGQERSLIVIRYPIQ